MRAIPTIQCLQDGRGHDQFARLLPDFRADPPIDDAFDDSGLSRRKGASPAMPTDKRNVGMIQRRAKILASVIIGCRQLLTTVVVGAATTAAVLVIGLSPRPAASLPLYARQTGQPCATCHTAFLELTPFGRRFKLGGYTLGGGDWNLR
jgi:hypothetical protein